MTKKLFVILTLISSQIFGNVCINVKIPSNPSYDYDDDIMIESFDGVKIAGNLFTPKQNNKAKIPTIIFVNSWTMEEHEYIKQAKSLVLKGYQVFSYSARGWGCSGGLANVIGPKDMNDLSHVIDWLYEHTNIDKMNVGIAGISYGGGMTLMALAKEPRIKTGFAMSTWASLSEAMYHQETPRLFWSSILMATGFVLGRVDSTLKDNFKNLILGKDTDKVLKWANERSPLEFVENINKRNTPVYISNNFGDNLFQPNNVIRFFNKLTTPKILDLNQGTHASGELSGLFTLNNYTFKKLHNWFDYWLKDIRTDTTLEFNTINMQIDLKKKRDTVSAVHPSKGLKKIFHLLPRKKLSYGKLSNTKFMEKRRDYNRISSRLDTFATTGVPLLSAIVDGHFKIPVYSFMPMIDPFHGIKFETAILTKPLKIRGVPKLKLVLDSQGSPYQVLIYLYDVNKFGTGKLITHGVYSGDEIDGNINVEVVATAYDIPAGSRLVMVVDTKDLLYAPKSLKTFKLDFKYSLDNTNSLELPLL